MMEVAIAMALLSGIMAVVLFYLGMTKNSDKILVWAVVFLGAALGMFEWSFWLVGEDMFRLFFAFAFPLVAWFLVWFAFIIWIFEEQKRRDIWIVFLIILIILTIIAVNCMDCLHV